MSELQLGLLAIGVAVVIGIFVYNKWQEHRYRKEANARFGDERGDALLDPVPKKVVEVAAKRVEPSLQAGAATATTLATASLSSFGPQDKPVVTKPMVGDNDIPPMPPRAFSTPAPGPQAEGFARPVLDARTDLIATLALETPVPGFELKAALRPVLEEDRPRPIFADGYDAHRQGFDALDDRQIYESVRLGLQLVSRGGPAVLGDLEQFHALVVATAEQLGTAVSWPEESNPLERAAALDATCVELDIQVGLNLVAADAAFLGTKVRALAEANGLQLESDGRFRRYNEDGELLYAMGDLENRPFAAADMKHMTARALTLTLDVPTSSPNSRAFDLMTQAAKHFSTGLNVPVVDDNKRPLNDQQIGQIRDQLEPLRVQMEAHGFPAGSALAKRLFS